MMILENINIIREIISAKCTQIGRDPSEINLIAVSKNQPIISIQEAFNSGIKDFGENRAQEFRDKTEEFKENVKWHFIGHLQTNKIKYVIKSAEFIHSVDTMKLAAEINKKAAAIKKTQKIMLEFNTSLEASKFGLSDSSELYELANFCYNAPNIELTGLMTMAPYTSDKGVIRKCFRRLKKEFDLLNQAGLGLTNLSMGMTNDYEIAIEEGANMLRIGTAVFG